MILVRLIEAFFGGIALVVEKFMDGLVRVVHRENHEKESKKNTDEKTKLKEENDYLDF